MSANISRDEWLKALGDAGYQDDVDDKDSISIDEFATMFGLPRTTAESRLRALVNDGKAVRSKKWGVTAYGRRVQLRTFRLVTPEKPTRKRKSERAA